MQNFRSLLTPLFGEPKTAAVRDYSDSYKTGYVPSRFGGTTEGVSSYPEQRVTTAPGFIPMGVTSMPSQPEYAAPAPLSPSESMTSMRTVHLTPQASPQVYRPFPAPPAKPQASSRPGFGKRFQGFLGPLTSQQVAPSGPIHDYMPAGSQRGPIFPQVIRTPPTREALLSTPVQPAVAREVATSAERFGQLSVMREVLQPQVIERAVEFPVDRQVLVPVERIVEVIKEVPVPRIVQVPVENRVEVPVIYEKIVEKRVEVPVIKYVERPVIFEKVVERTREVPVHIEVPVYVPVPIQSAQAVEPAPPPAAATFAALPAPLTMEATTTVAPVFTTAKSLPTVNIPAVPYETYQSQPPATAAMYETEVETTTATTTGAAEGVGGVAGAQEGVQWLQPTEMMYQPSAYRGFYGGESSTTAVGTSAQPYTTQPLQERVTEEQRVVSQSYE